MPKLRALAIVAFGVAVVVGALLFARRGDKSPPQGFRVPRTTGAIRIDGETDDGAWLGAPGPARTGAFHFADGTPGRPYSEARMVWANGFLYLALYAADEDIQTRTEHADGPLWLDDSFRLVFTVGKTEYAIEVSPKCVVSDGRRVGQNAFDYAWKSGVQVACDTDGTINDASDMDEEWVVEMAVPLDALGIQSQGGPFRLTIQRCDTPKSAARVCTFWANAVVLM